MSFVCKKILFNRTKLNFTNKISSSAFSDCKSNYWAYENRSLQDNGISLSSLLARSFFKQIQFLRISFERKNDKKTAKNRDIKKKC